jgi:hypothetical protein
MIAVIVLLARGGYALTDKNEPVCDANKVDEKLVIHSAEDAPLMNGCHDGDSCRAKAYGTLRSLDVL